MSKSNNWHTIILYLKDNPGSRSLPVRQHLCVANKKTFKSPGQYTWYFSMTTGSFFPRKLGGDFGYIEKVGRGWHVTDKGLAYLAKS